MTKINKVLMLLALTSGMTLTVSGQEKIVNPDITYSGNPHTYKLAGLAVSGIDGYEDYVLTGISGLSIGQELEVPGTAITDAVKRYWKHGLFSDVSISADSIVGGNIYLRINLLPRPRVSTINYNGLKKSVPRYLLRSTLMIKDIRMPRLIFSSVMMLRIRIRSYLISM